ncbi:MAG: hypothetical protein CL669_00050 [Balneola sp.]|nr:hypothetical protein [Balneola sp.]|tara:strand:+ start:165 stop:656 length:492 start_codon:yes stop_codon:yes gene_type:complete
MSGFLASLGFDVREEKIRKEREKKERVIKSIKEKLIEFCDKQIGILDKEGLGSSNKGKCWSKEVIIEPGTMNRVREFYVRGERNRKYFFGVEETGKMTYVSDNKNEVKDYIVRLRNGINESDESDFKSGGSKECVYIKGKNVFSVDSGEIIFSHEDKKYKKKN